MRLENSELRAFRAVIEEGGFKRAADALHISQSAVSQAVAPGNRIFSPTGFWSGQSRLAARSLSTTAYGVPSRSSLVNPLPRANDSPRVRK